MSSSSQPKRWEQNHVVKHDLYRGHPNNKLLPRSEMQSIMSDMSRDAGDGDDSWVRYLNYGQNAGDDRFLRALRSFLDRQTSDDDYGGIDRLPSSSYNHEFFITGGVSHGLELLCATCTQPSDEVWVERPTYFLAPQIMKSHGLIVKSLPMILDRTEGEESDDVWRVDIDHLVRMVEEDNVPPPRMIYIIPSYHNPTGRSMTVEERKKMASFALRNNILLICDEVYHLLDWVPSSGVPPSDAKRDTTQRPAGMVHFNNMQRDWETKTASKAYDSQCASDGCCVSVSSFTKIWAPGVRLGWIDAPVFIIERLKKYGYIDSQGGVAPFMGRLMTQAIESGVLDSYLDGLRSEYSERYTLVCKMLQEESRIVLSRYQSVQRYGGYFVWVQFPIGVNSDEFFSYSMENFGVRFMSGGRCDPFSLAGGHVSGLSVQSCARLCFADLDREELKNALRAFLDAFRSYMNVLNSN